MARSPRSGRNPYPGMPSQHRVLDRLHVATGHPELDASSYSADARLGVGFGTAGMGNDQACLLLEWQKFYTPHILTAFIGNYDPARGRWRFYPDYVHKSEQGPLHRYYAGELEPGVQLVKESRQVPSGRLVIDSFHRDTRAVRREMAGHLAGVDANAIAQRALEEGQLDHKPARAGLPGTRPEYVIADEGTLVYPALAVLALSGERGEEVGEDEIITHPINDTGMRGLVLMYRGVRTNRLDRPDRSVRHDITVSVGFSTEDGRWAPNPNVVGASEWQALSPLPGILQLAEVTTPNFSAYHAAVTYNSNLGPSTVRM